jgi:antitoxin YefM
MQLLEDDALTAISLTEARTSLFKLVERAFATHERYEITRNGQRAAVLLSADDYDSLQETIGVLSDSTFFRSILRGSTRSNEATP